MSAREVIVVGGGVAGLAAACALADAGRRVRVVERRPYLGGRASSYAHPGTGEVIDNCQHILLGCCTNLIDFYRQLGVQNQIFWSNTVTFLEPGGRVSRLAPSALPAPFHTVLSFLRARCFTAADKLAITRGILGFLRPAASGDEEDFASWLVRHRQTPRAIGRFWRPVLASALNEDPERISLRYAAKVFREAFLFSARGGEMGIPRIPLSELYGRAASYLKARGGEVLLRTSVIGLEPRGPADWTVRAAGGGLPAESVVLALPFEALRALLPALPRNVGSEALERSLGAFEHSPITSVHLWFDREITRLTHAALLDATIQWMYNQTLLREGARDGHGSYLELVISASKSLVRMERQAIIDLALEDLERFFPSVRQASLLKSAVTKEVRATYSIRPRLDRSRPASTSPWPNVYLAGDWTATGWPSTMESAVRSGRLAAEALLARGGDARKFLVPDLPPTGLMRVFSGRRAS